MKAKARRPTTIDAYIAGFPRPVQRALAQVRATIRKAAPAAEEELKYGMPAYALGGPLVYFAAFAHHVGFYATPTGHAAFAKALAGYRSGKGSVQFPLAAPMPLALIARIVKFRVRENAARVRAKAAKAARPARARKTAKATPTARRRR